VIKSVSSWAEDISARILPRTLVRLIIVVEQLDIRIFAVRLTIFFAVRQSDFSWSIRVCIKPFFDTNLY
jgi:hypothetical protein